MSVWIRVTPCLFLLAAACAHEQPAVTARVPAPPVAEAPPPAPPAPAKRTEDDLTRLLAQPISHFDLDQAVLTAADREQLQALARALKSDPSARIQIAGNCDERGTEDYNLHLGQKRAAVAKGYLTKLGVEPARLETISYGKNRPLDSGHTEPAWAANRRDDAARLPPLGTH